MDDGKMSAACIFCEIASGRTPAPIVFESDGLLAFLDHRPLFPGHCLLIPREHYSTLPDLPEGETGPLFRVAGLLCSAMEDALGAQGTFVAINNRVSQSVPHLHVHIVPRREKDGLKGFFWPRKKYQNSSEIETVRDQLQRAMQRLISSPGT
jgi:histidine triad (HIT) family protein